jgi:hypothetical protein
MGKGLICLGAATFLSLSAAPLAQSVPSLRLRAYNGFGVAGPEIVLALRTAEEILRDAGLVPSWRECRTPSGPSAAASDRCDDVVAGAEMVLRLVAAPRSVRPPVTLGFSHVDAGTGVGTLATVFPDRVKAMAARTGTNAGVLMGRVVAHEVGHLLLGTMAHASGGLMRGHWTDEAVRAQVSGDWLFSRDEAVRMRRAALARAVAAPRLGFRRLP